MRSNMVEVEGESKSFYFQKRRGQLDIRALSKIDLETIVQDVDIDTLQSMVENLTFCELKEKDLKQSFKRIL